MQSNFRVQVSKDYLVFASAHFITFRGHQCESLHGHNYRVGVAVEGSVDAETFFVLDFSVLKQITRQLVDEIDHKVLLPDPESQAGLPRGRRPPARWTTSASRPTSSRGATAPCSRSRTAPPRCWRSTWASRCATS